MNANYKINLKLFNNIAGTYIEHLEFTTRYKFTNSLRDENCHRFIDNLLSVGNIISYLSSSK